VRTRLLGGVGAAVRNDRGYPMLGANLDFVEVDAIVVSDPLCSKNRYYSKY
jgi:hypothetical protein